MTKKEIAQFILGIKNMNNGQISVLLRLLESPLAEPMDSEQVEKTVKRLAK